jgi:hypothetical protein
LFLLFLFEIRTFGLLEASPPSGFPLPCPANKKKLELITLESTKYFFYGDQSVRPFPDLGPQEIAQCVLGIRVARFFLVQNIPNGHKTYQYFKFQGPPKYTLTENFGMKIHHLATLLGIPIIMSPLITRIPKPISS